MLDTLGQGVNMALPENVLSDPAVPTGFVGAALNPITRTLDYEDGGIALNDPSMGQNYQVWQAVIRDEKIFISAPSVPEFEFYSGTAVTDVSIAFDQNMRLHVAYTDNEVTKFYWFNTLTGQSETLTLGEGYLTPKCSLDDKRSIQSGGSDIILAYVKDGELCYRQQRDRFLIERVLAEGPFYGISKLGMNAGNRLQFLMVSEND